MLKLKNCHSRQGCSADCVFVVTQACPRAAADNCRDTGHSQGFHIPPVVESIDSHMIQWFVFTLHRHLKLNAGVTRRTCATHLSIQLQSISFTVAASAGATSSEVDFNCCRRGDGFSNNMAMSQMTVWCVCCRFSSDTDLKSCEASFYICYFCHFKIKTMYIFFLKATARQLP